MLRTGVPASPYSVISEPVSGWLRAMPLPRNASELTPPSASPLMLTRAVARPGNVKPVEPRAREIEDLQPLASIRRIGDDESRRRVRDRTPTAR